MEDHFKGLTDADKIKGTEDATKHLEDHSIDHTNKIIKDFFPDNSIGIDQKINRVLKYARNSDGSINMDLINPIDDSFIDKINDNTTENEIIDMLADSNIDYEPSVGFSNTTGKKTITNTQELTYMKNLISDIQDNIPINKDFERGQIAKFNRARLTRAKRIIKVMKEKNLHGPLRNFLLSTQDLPESGVLLPEMEQAEQLELEKPSLPNSPKVLTPDEIIERRNLIKNRIIKPRGPRGIRPRSKPSLKDPIEPSQKQSLPDIQELETDEPLEPPRNPLIDEPPEPSPSEPKIQLPKKSKLDISEPETGENIIEPNLPKIDITQDEFIRNRFGQEGVDLYKRNDIENFTNEQDELFEQIKTSVNASIRNDGPFKTRTLVKPGQIQTMARTFMNNLDGETIKSIITTDEIDFLKQLKISEDGSRFLPDEFALDNIDEIKELVNKKIGISDRAMETLFKDFEKLNTSAETFISDDGLPISYEELSSIVPGLPRDVYEKLSENFKKFNKDNLSVGGIKKGINFIREKFSKMTYMELFKYGATTAFAGGGIGLSLMNAQTLKNLTEKIDNAFDAIGAPQIVKDATKSVMKDMLKYGTSQTKQFTDTLQQFLREHKELGGLQEAAQSALQIFNQPSSSIVTDNENNEKYKRATQEVQDKEESIEERINQISKQAQIAKESIERKKDEERMEEEQKEKKKIKKERDTNKRIKKVEEQFDKLPEQLERSIRPQLAGDSMKSPINVNIVNRLQSPTTANNTDDINDGIENDDDNDKQQEIKPLGKNDDVFDMVETPQKQNNFIRKVNVPPIKRKLKL